MSSVEQTVEQKPAASVAPASVVRAARARWWRRRGSKRGGFRYETIAGGRVTDDEQLQRIKSLAVPPAWSEVRISPSARSSLQAIGIDAGGRVQRIYHTSFTARQQLHEDSVSRYLTCYSGRSTSLQMLKNCVQQLNSRALSVICKASQLCASSQEVRVRSPDAASFSTSK